jgi:hypothetical protein
MHRLRFRDAATGSLLSITLASGCYYGHCPKGSPLLSHRTYLSGAVLKKTNEEFRTGRVLLSRYHRIPRICLTGSFESFGERTEAGLKSYSPYLDYLNLKNPKVVAMIENTVFVVGQNMQPDHLAGSYWDGPSLVKMNPIITDQNGCVVCRKDTCKNYDMVILPDREKPIASVLVHELLHDAWTTILPKELKHSFLAVMNRILDVGGAGEGADRIFIYLPLYSVQSIGFDFVGQSPSLGDKEKRDLVNAIVWFYEFRKSFARDYAYIRKYSRYTRQKYLDIEGYPWAFDTHSPPFLNRFYTSIISEKGFKELQLRYESSHLSSMEEFDKLLPVLEAFVRYLKSKPPEYWKEIEKIKTFEDFKRHLQQKHGLPVS